MAAVLFSVAYNVAIARSIGPEGKGLYSLAILAPMMLATFTAMNLGAGATYYIGNGKFPARDVAGTVFSACLGLTLVFGAAYLLLLDKISLLAFRGVSTDLLLVSFFIYPAFMLGIPFNALLLGRQEIRATALIDLLRAAAAAALIAGALLFLGAGVKGAVAATAASFWVGLFANWAAARRLGETFRPVFRPAIFSEVALYSLKGFAGNVIQLLNYRLDVFLINFFLSPLNVGIYSAAVMLAEMIWYVPNAVGYVLFPKISASDKATADRITPQISRISLAITLAAGTALLALAPMLIRLLFGERFSAAAAPLHILVPGVIALGLTKVLGNDLAARGKPEYPAITSALAMTISATAGVLSIPSYGIAGAAAATSFSYCASALTISLIYKKHTGIGPLSFLLPCREDLELFRGIVRKIF